MIAVDGAWVPAGGEASLYVRPFIFATEAGPGHPPVVGVPLPGDRLARRRLLQGGIKGVSVWLSTEYVRASPGGTGAAKFGGNYAASLLAQAEAAEHGCDQVVWLDAIERRYIEEMGGMNLFFVFGSGGSARLVTPELSGSLLPGSPATRCCSWPATPLRRRGAQDRRRRAAQGCRRRRDHRGVRLRDGQR